MPDLVEIQYNPYEPGQDRETHTAGTAHIIDGVVFSGVMVDLTQVQAVRLRQRLPSGHHPTSTDRDCYLEMTLHGGGTVDMLVWHPGHAGERLEYARKVMAEVQQQLRQESP